MDESDLHAFRINLRLALVERLVLQHALTEPVLNHQLSMPDSLRLLEIWLEDNAREVGKLAGEKFQEPGQTALFSDEAEDVANGMKAILAKIAAM